MFGLEREPPRNRMKIGRLFSGMGGRGYNQTVNARKGPPGQDSLPNERRPAMPSALHPGAPALYLRGDTP